MKNLKKPIITLLGAPGSGKGTQAKLLIKKFNLEYFGSGRSLRMRQRINDFTGKKLKKVMNRGELVPSFVVSKLWIDVFEKLKRKGNFKGLVLDGSPRKKLEAKIFNGAVKWYEWEKNFKVIFIDVSEKESISRLMKRRQCKKCGRIVPWIDKFKTLKKCDKCGSVLTVRADDKPKAIKKRWEEFRKEVIPTINFFKKQKKLIKINGKQGIEKVFKDIVKAVK